MTRLIIATQDLRQALAALKGHIPSGKDAMYAWVRGAVTGPNLELTATNAFMSMAIAIVSIIENEDGEAGVFDLTLSEIAELLMVFKSGGVGGEDDIGATLRLETTEIPTPAIRVTDISGFWPGKSVSFPRASIGDPGDFPDIADAFQKVLARAPKAPERVITNGPALAAFARAAAAYGQPLVIESVSDTGRTLLVSCGESFLGLLMTSDLDEDRQVQLKEWREAWVRRLVQ